MAVGEETQFIVLLAVTIIFSMVALERQRPWYHMLAAVIWWLGAAANLGMGAVGGVLTLPMTATFFGIGLFFFILSIYTALQLLHDATQQRYAVDVV